MKMKKIWKGAWMLLFLCLCILVPAGKAKAAYMMVSDDTVTSVVKGNTLPLKVIAAKFKAEESNEPQFWLQIFRGTTQVKYKNVLHINVTKSLEFSAYSTGTGMATARLTMNIDTNELETGSYQFVCSISTKNETARHNQHSYAVTVTDNHTHNWSESIVSSPTCTQRGVTLKTCTICGAHEYIYTSPLGHEYDNGMLTKKPTEGATGSMTLSCTRCGHQLIRIIPALGAPEPGSVFAVDNLVYKVTKSAAEAAVLGTVKTPTKVSIPAIVTKNDIQYKVTSIAAGAFEGKRIKEVVLGIYIKTIGRCAFYNCKNLQKISTVSALTSIEGYAFYNCTALKTVRLPENVKKIGKKAFCGCKSLNRVSILSTKLTSKKVLTQAFYKTGAKALFMVPSAKFGSYKTILKNKGKISKNATVRPQ